MDSCMRTGLVFQDLVSSCEVVNCTSVEVQSTGIMPTIAIDKTDGIAVSCLHCFLRTSQQLQLSQSQALDSRR